MSLLKRLRIAIEKPFIFAFDALEYLRDFWDVRIQHRHRIVLRETPGALPTTPLRPRVAIVAVYPTEESLPFTTNLLRTLHTNGFFVLAISTRKLPEAMHASILADCHHLIERASIGRDFGSYKMGLNWLERKAPGLAGADTLVLANDSLFYPAAFREQFKKMLLHTADWQCLFENYEHHYHAQSFFLIFRKSVFLSPIFQEFWQNYKPYSSRRHSINYGEVKFSADLRTAGYNALAAFSSTKIVETLLSTDCPLNAVDFAELAPSTKDWSISRDRIFTSAITAHANHPRDVEKSRWVYAIAHRCERSNPTHALALLANRLLSAPIKRDICYRGTYDICQVLNLAHGFTSPELKAMASDLNRRGLPISQSGLKSIFWRHGRI